MFRTTVRSLNFSNRICSPNNFNIGQCQLNIQSVRRWRYRRPLELGSSKSKLFFVPQKSPKNTDEYEELKRLNKIYDTRMESLRNFFKEQKQKHDEALAQKPQSIEDDADFERISKINDEWNQNVAKIRDARLTRQRIEMRKKIEWELEQQRQYEEEERRKINELVLKEKEAAKSFIVRENFDDALELALKTKSDFNYAIDIKGNIYPGRTGNEKQQELESK